MDGTPDGDDNTDGTRVKNAGHADASQGRSPQLEGILALAGSAIISVDANGTITLFNRGAEQLFGYSAGDVLGQPLALLVPEMADVGADVSDQRLLRGRNKDGGEFLALTDIARLATPAGTCLTLLLRGSSPAPTATGDPFDSNSLLQFIQDAVFTTDLQFHITGWNRAAEALYGWSAAEAIGRTVREVLQTNYTDSERAALSSQFQAHGMWQGEGLQRHRDGHTLSILASLAAIRSPSGETIGTITVNRDISERKAAEAQLRSHARRMEVLAKASHIFAETGLSYQVLLDRIAQNIVDSLGDFCLIRMLSADEQWLPAVASAYYDPADVETHSVIKQAIGGTPMHVDDPHLHLRIFHSGTPLLVPRIDRERFMASLVPTFRPMFERFPPHSAITVAIRLNGRSIGLLGLFRVQSTQPAFDDADLALVLNLVDRAALAISNARLYEQAQREIAERLHAEHALHAERALLARRVAERTADLSRANAELSRAVHLKDEFLATMSHELRTPLNAILGRAEALQEEVYGPLMPRQDTAVHAIRESGQHLLSLINDILDLSKIEAGQLELELQPVDVEQLCGASLHMVAQSAAVKHITLRSSLDALVVRVAADERRLRQILLNLLANAIKFTSVGGTVELELRGDAEHGRVTFAVTDTGIGIADEDLGKLFQPFVQIDSRLSRRYDGTGLGLALVRRMAEAHAGSVAVESVPGQGSRFSVTLPWSAAEAGIPAAPTPVAPALQPAGASDRQPRILLAEASPASSQMLLDLLAARDYAVSVVRTGGEALARVYEARPDAILLDIHMPELDGLDVIRRIRAAPGLGDVPIIALTALAIPGDRERCLAAGADDYLAKPVNLRTLLAALDAQRQ